MGASNCISAVHKPPAAAALLVFACWMTGCANLRPAPEIETVLRPALPAVESLPGASVLSPSNHRDWDPNLAVLADATIDGDDVTIRNVRNTSYITETDYLIKHEDRQFKLSDLETVDFILVPFADAPALAHTMLSFGLKNGQYLCVSAEVRLERDEVYSPVTGAMRQFELMYVVGTERDLFRLRVEHRKADVYIYPAKATPQQVQTLFVDVMRRVNQLAGQPEFYDTVTNNCTTAIVRHINALAPGRIPADIRVLLPGYSARMAYDLGLLDTKLSFEETTSRVLANRRILAHRDDRDFSRKIRQHAPLR